MDAQYSSFKQLDNSALISASAIDQEARFGQHGFARQERWPETREFRLSPIVILVIGVQEGYDRACINDDACGHGARS